MKKHTKLLLQIKAALTARSPNVFSIESPKPLARKTIAGEIAKTLPGAPFWAIKLFLARWTKRNTYLKAIAQPKSLRLHLDGTVSERVKESHRQAAIEELVRRGVLREQSTAK